MADIKWNKDSLYRLVREKLGDYRFLVASNREPYVHDRSGDRIVAVRPVSGLTQALDPVLRAAKGCWIAHGSGTADKEVVDEHDRVSVPPEYPEYTLRRVWLSKNEIAGFYLGFSNQALWPLCHIAFTPPVFRETDWQAYEKVNHLFAGAIGEEIGDRSAVVLLQDYHLALVARLLKKQRPNLTVGQFWHIPWPPQEVFRTCPWQSEVLAGLLGNDLLGFHTREFCDNFLETAASGLDAEINKRTSLVKYNGHTTLIKPFPIGVDFAGISEEAESHPVAQEVKRLRRELSLEGKHVGIGIDRLDYTKGIPERLMALDRFFADFPEYVGKVVLIQVGMSSRTQIESYRAIDCEIESQVKAINEKYRRNNWQPVIPLTGQLAPETLAALRQLAHFCIVSSRHDGMNLVAKEYVASRTNGDGVLILSRFTGAAAELKEALLINPFDTGGFARAIKQALEMPEAEQRRRMKAMQNTVETNNIYRWGADIVSELIALVRK